MATQLQGCFKMKSSFHARSVTIPVGPLANLQQHCSIWILHHSLRHSFVHFLSWLHQTFIPPKSPPFANSYKELSRDWASRETNMNHESSGGIECSKHSLLHFVASNLNAKVWTNIHNQYPHCRVLTGQPELRSCDFQKTSTEISGKCGGHAWMINLVVLVNPVVGETERCQGEKDRSR